MTNLSTTPSIPQWAYSFAFGSIQKMCPLSKSQILIPLFLPSLKIKFHTFSPTTYLLGQIWKKKNDWHKTY
jgi:hypothetical protein